MVPGFSDVSRQALRADTAEEPSSESTADHSQHVNQSAGVWQFDARKVSLPRLAQSAVPRTVSDMIEHEVDLAGFIASQS